VTKTPMKITDSQPMIPYPSEFRILPKLSGPKR
jgi:hypothetical protein